MVFSDTTYDVVLYSFRLAGTRPSRAIGAASSNWAACGPVRDLGGERSGFGPYAAQFAASTTSTDLPFREVLAGRAASRYRSG
jgi:hypothetical protein